MNYTNYFLGVLLSIGVGSKPFFNFMKDHNKVSMSSQYATLNVSPRPLYNAGPSAAYAIVLLLFCFGLFCFGFTSLST